MHQINLMHVISKLRASVTGPQLIAADDVGIHQRTGGDTLRRIDDDSTECHMAMDSLVESNTAWCGICHQAPHVTSSVRQATAMRTQVASILEMETLPVRTSDGCGSRHPQV